MMQVEGYKKILVTKRELESYRLHGKVKIGYLERTLTEIANADPRPQDILLQKSDAEEDYLIYIRAEGTGFMGDLTSPIESTHATNLGKLVKDTLSSNPRIKLVRIIRPPWLQNTYYIYTS